MSEQAVIDSPDFARKGLQMALRVPVAQFTRLQEALKESTGELDFVLSGFVDPQEGTMLRLSIAGQLRLVCQRCLGPVDHSLALNRQFVLYAEENQLGDLAEENPEVDHILGSRNMNVLDLVEEEVLLSLPLFPRHAEAACRLASTEVAATHRPMAGLKELWGR